MRLTPEQQEEARRLYGEEGVTCAVIGRQFGVSLNAIYHHVMGIERGGGHRLNPPKQLLTSADRIRARFAPGCTPRAGR